MIIPVSQSHICVNANGPEVNISRPKHSSAGMRRHCAELYAGWLVHQHLMCSSCGGVQFQAVLNAHVHLTTAPKDPQCQTGMTQ
jgi:hypothetical protein